MKKIRLLNVLAELCKCDPRNILWDSSGSVDVVKFTPDPGNGNGTYMLKISRDNSGTSCDGFMDFRIRVLRTE